MRLPTVLKYTNKRPRCQRTLKSDCLPRERSRHVRPRISIVRWMSAPPLRTLSMCANSQHIPRKGGEDKGGGGGEGSEDDKGRGSSKINVTGCAKLSGLAQETYYLPLFECIFHG